jgi:arylformamidase
MIHDITPPISERTRVWPGDTPISREILCDMAPPRGDNITLSTLRSTVHLGAHADGPNHYSYPASGIGERKLDHYLGPCHLLDAPVARNSRVRIADVRWPAASGVDSIRHPRILLRTNTFPDFEHWNADFAALDPALIDALAGRGVITIGLDTPSVDLQDSKDLPAHAAFARHDMAILEGLALRGVPAGEYELIALPLKLIGFDASPVRAILRPLPA